MRGTSENSARKYRDEIQEYHSTGVVQEGAVAEGGTLGRKILEFRYYVGTVGERGNWAMVEKYVLEQGKPKEDLRQLTLW